MTDEEETNDEEDEEVKEEPKTLYEKTNAATERLEEANKVTAENLQRTEELYEKRKLGGESNAGKEVVKKEETPAEYTKRVMTGEFNG